MQPTINITPFPACQPHQAASPSWNVGVMPVPGALEPLKKRMPAATAAPSPSRQHAHTPHPAGWSRASEH